MSGSRTYLCVFFVASLEILLHEAQKRRVSIRIGGGNQTSGCVAKWLTSQVRYSAACRPTNSKTGSEVNTVSHIPVGDVGRTLTSGHPGERDRSRYDARSKCRDEFGIGRKLCGGECRAV